MIHIPIGSRVIVPQGRWVGREGKLLGYSVSWTAPQPQVYPVVELEARGRAKSRVVRVVAVRAA